MKTIHRFEVPVQDELEIPLPLGAEVRHFEEHRRTQRLCVWVELEDAGEVPMAQRKFRMVGTGHQIDFHTGSFIGTAQDHLGLVWHLYEVT